MLLCYQWCWTSKHGYLIILVPHVIQFPLSQSKLQIIDKIIYFVTKQHNEKLLYKHWLNQIVKRRKQIDEKHFNRKIYWRQVCTSYQIDSHLDLRFSCELFAREWYWVCHQLSKCTATIKPVLCDLPRVVQYGYIRQVVA